MMSKRNQSDVDVGWHTQHTPASSVLISISSLVLYDVTETVDKSLYWDHSACTFYHTTACNARRARYWYSSPSVRLSQSTYCL